MRVLSVNNDCSTSNKTKYHHNTTSFNANTTTIHKGLLYELKPLKKIETRKFQANKLISLAEDELEYFANKIENFWF